MLATVHSARSQNATTFCVHGHGLIVGLIVSEPGLARTVTAAVKEAFGSGHDAGSAAGKA